VIRLPGGLAKPALIGLAGLLVLLMVGVLLAPVLLFAGGGLMFSTGSTCASGTTTTAQPAVSTQASDSIPANYLSLFKSIGAKYKVPWVVLAGIGRSRATTAVPRCLACGAGRTRSVPRDQCR